MSIVRELAVIALLVLANALFAAAEIAILSVRKTRLQELADEGRRSAELLLRVREHPESFFATVQVGITVVAAAAAAFGGATVAIALEPVFEPAVGAAWAGDLALALVVAAVTFLTVVFGELVPKSLALRSAERVALLAARPFYLLSRVAQPVVWILTATSNVVLHAFGDRTTFTESRLSKDELQQLVEDATAAGDLDARAGKIAYRALDFGDVRVGAVMIPRPDMVVVARDASAEAVRELLLATPHERYPVRGSDAEGIVGYVTARDLFRMSVDASSDAGLRAVLREALFVPESLLAAEVLREMQTERAHLALVIDENGDVSGLVTIEDIVEELVGEIFGEDEVPIERIEREADGSILVRGRVPVHELNRELGLDLPENERAWSTIAGLATALAGRVPPPGTTLDTRRGTTIEVLESTERRVGRVRIRWPRQTPAARAAAH